MKFPFEVLMFSEKHTLCPIQRRNSIFQVVAGRARPSQKLDFDLWLLITIDDDDDNNDDVWMEKKNRQRERDSIHVCTSDNAVIIRFLFTRRKRTGKN